ncbi:hypothetical protein ACTFIV_000626 [Dictyostelium citrinum]
MELKKIDKNNSYKNIDNNINEIPLINQVIFTNTHNKSIIISNQENHFKQEISVSSIIVNEENENDNEKENKDYKNEKENEKIKILERDHILELGSSKDEDINETDYIEKDGYSIVSLDHNDGNDFKKQSFFKRFFCFG